MKTVFSELFAPCSDITAFFTTRHGGVSRSPYTSGNLAFHVGDETACVLENHERLAQKMGYERTSLVHMRQIHSDLIIEVDESFTFDTPPQCDALITNKPGIPLMVMSADCTPILLYDPSVRAIAAIHAGREGALKEILPKTIRALIARYGAKPETIQAVLGPSIHGCCYEINAEIADQTRSKGYPHALREEEERVYLDVNTILRSQLEKEGIKSFEVIEHCTSCRCDEYFSYRADNRQTGRIAGVIMLRSV